MFKKGIMILSLTFILGMMGIGFSEVPQVVTEAKVLQADETWTGDFNVRKDVDLNGHTLTIDGNLILSEKSLKVNNGRLIVNGDFRIQNMKKDSMDLDYDQLTEDSFQFCKGLLRMDSPKDYVLVKGNFYPNGDNNILRAGLVELKGNFIYSTNAYVGCYDALGTHKTLFSGEGDQIVQFARSGSRFNVLGIEKPSGNMIFKSPIDIRSIDRDTVIPVGGNGYLYLETISTSKIMLNGKTLTVNGNLLLSRGELVFGGGRLIVDQDLRVQSIRDMRKKVDLSYNQLVPSDFGVPVDFQLAMLNAKDYMLVRGNAYFASSKEATKLRAGTMELQRDFYQLASTPKSFIAYENHKTILSGEKGQKLFFTAPSYYRAADKKLVVMNHFNKLEITHPNVVLQFSEKISSTAKRSVKHIANMISPKDYKFKYLKTEGEKYHEVDQDDDGSGFERGFGDDRMCK